MSSIRLKRSKLSELLVGCHTHAEIAYEENCNQIVYKEKDIIDLLKKIKENKTLLDDFEIDES
jgi:hypothetical protein